ncbi:MAG: hypothetical protein SFU99_00145 [Saprospiraceae bacterium]|nr:hypothetical protein [Saprospiraceae bacterium]
MKILLNGLYSFLIIMLLILFCCYDDLSTKPLLQWTFFIGWSVFNLFSISLYWSLMVYLLDKDRAKASFGYIAAGGSAGAIAGSALAGFVSHWGDTSFLLLIGSALLFLFLYTQNKILYFSQTQEESKCFIKLKPYSFRYFWQPIRYIYQSSFLSSMAVSNFIYAIMNTFLYYEQLSLVENFSQDYIEKTTLLALIATIINTTTLIIQLFLFQKLIAHSRSNFLLTAVPLLTLLSFVCLICQPSIILLILSITIHRAGNYSIIKPLREIFYTNITKDAKFGAKNFADTIFSRGGDLAGSWWCGLIAEGLGIKFLLISVIPLGIWWFQNSRKLANYDFYLHSK